MTQVDKRTDVLLLLPPQWIPVSPYSALPIIAGEVKAAGYKCELRDLNIEYFNKIFTPEYLKWCKLAADKRLAELHDEFLANILNDEYSNFDTQNNEYFFMKDKIEAADLYWEMAVSRIDEAKQILKDKEQFFNPQKIQWAFDMVGKAQNLASLPYYPTRISVNDFKNKNIKLTIESITSMIDNKSENPFIDFYESIFDSIIKSNPMSIGISINSYTQVLAGLTLSKILKEKLKNTHININGNFFTLIANNLQQKPKFFEQFCHSLIEEETEISIVKLIKALKTDNNLLEVPNLLHLKNSKVVKNEKNTPKELNLIANPYFAKLDLNSYLTPEIIFQMRVSRGCDRYTLSDNELNYDLKSPDKLVSEIKHLKKNYNIRHYEFIDESISPLYLKKMSKAILKENLDIKFFMYAKTKKGFTQEILDLAYKAGCCVIMWRIESGSDRIINLISKDIDIESRFNPLRFANKAGIWNCAFVTFGFPSETSEEAMMTINMLMDNRNVINSYGQNLFSLDKHIKFKEYSENFGISDIKKTEEELSPSLDYKIMSGMSKDQMTTASELCAAICSRIYRNPLWLSTGFREYLYMYLAHYGLDYVKNYSFIKT